MIAIDATTSVANRPAAIPAIVRQTTRPPIAISPTIHVATDRWAVNGLNANSAPMMITAVVATGKPTAARPSTRSSGECGGRERGGRGWFTGMAGAGRGIAGVDEDRMEEGRGTNTTYRGSARCQSGSGARRSRGTADRASWLPLLWTSAPRGDS